ncbi:MAG: helix-turn-helix transcriptional regulator [Planctomycetota bacterium]
MRQPNRIDDTLPNCRQVRTTDLNSHRSALQPESARYRPRPPRSLSIRTSRVQIDDLNRPTQTLPHRVANRHPLVKDLRHPARRTAICVGNLSPPEGEPRAKRPKVRHLPRNPLAVGTFPGYHPIAPDEWDTSFRIVLYAIGEPLSSSLPAQAGNESDASRILWLLKRFNLSQTELARSVGYQPQYVNDILHGRKNLSRNAAEKIAAEYNLSVHWLLTGEGAKYRPPTTTTPTRSTSATGRPTTTAPAEEYPTAPVIRRTYYECGACGGRVAPGLDCCQHCLCRLEWPEEDVGETEE